MKKVEATGRTTEEALRDAAQQLGVSVDALEYEIIEEGSKGFLGLGQIPTTVRAWVGKTDVPKARTEPVVEAVEETVEPEPEPEPEPAAPVQAEQEPVAEVRAAEAPEGDLGELTDHLVSFLDDVLEAMHLGGKAAVKSVDSQEIVIELTGKDMAILIGKQGQTLDALQYIAGIVASRVMDTRHRVILDAEGYRERHKEMLQQKALEYAKAAAEAGKEAVLEPQPARDRRIVHLALADHPDVYTYSEGEGDQRHVVISPKK